MVHSGLKTRLSYSKSRMLSQVAYYVVIPVVIPQPFTRSAKTLSLRTFFENYVIFLNHLMLFLLTIFKISGFTLFIYVEVSNLKIQAEKDS